MLKYLGKIPVEALWAACLAGLIPLLWVQGESLWERPHFQFFPIAWGAFAYLVYSRAQFEWSQKKMRLYIGLSVATLSIASTALAVWLPSPWLAHIAFILLLTGWGLARLGPVPWPRVIAWTSLLWVTVPLPMNYDTLLVTKLQEASSASASAVLDVFSIPHLRQGNTIEIRQQKLFVAEACSGVDSLYSLFAVALLLTIWQQRPFITSLMTVLSVPAWAWLGNVARLVAIAVLMDTLGWDITHGWRHTVLGLIVFIVSFGCLLLTLEGMGALFGKFPSAVRPREGIGLYRLYNFITCWPGQAPQILVDDGSYFQPRRSKTPSKPAPQANAAASLIPKSTFLVMSYAIGFLVLGAIGFARLPALQKVPHLSEETVHAALGLESMPEKLGRGSRAGFSQEHRESSSLFGEHSAIWQYTHPNGDLVVALDFPFRGFHSLWACYALTGHKAAQLPKLIEIAGPKVSGQTENGSWPVYFAVYRNDLGDLTYVWYSVFDKDAIPVFGDIQIQNQPTGWMDRIFNPASAPEGVQPVTYQYQMVVESTAEFSQEQVDEYLAIFQEGREFAIQHAAKLAAEIQE